MARTSIEWCNGKNGMAGRSWNPVTGCTKVGTECDRCYAMEIAERFRGEKAWPNGFDLQLRPARLGDPYRWRKPSRVFVNSMSDLFHKEIDFAYIDRVFDTMENTPQHTYLILTKRVTIMDRYVTHRWGKTDRDFTAPNHIWFGVSCGTKAATSRLSILRGLAGDGFNTFVSFEPLLEWMGYDIDLQGIRWAIVGGESGRGARYMDMDWVRGIRRNCKKHGVAFFMKQNGTAWMWKHRKMTSKGGRLEDLPLDLRTRDIPENE